MNISREILTYIRIKLVTDRIKKQDVDGDGLIDNDGFADQTYDAWAVTGAR